MAQPGEASGEAEYDFFIAHAGADAAAAIRLHDLLVEGGASTFVAARDLQPGDIWDDELPKAQRKAGVTVVVVSRNTEKAWYAREEIADAIELARRKARRVVPVYLDRNVEPPYGLQRVHSLLAVDDAALVQASQQLLELRAPQLGRPLRALAAIFCDWVPPVPRHFAHRDTVLERLASRARPAHGPLTQALTGMGGAGKTSVAAAYAWQRRADCAVVWWIRAETPASLIHDFAELATRAGLPSPEGAEPATRAEAARDWLAQRPGGDWLLVFDNAPGPSDVEPWLPATGMGEVLITSRYRHFDELAALISLDVFDLDTATTFLCNRVRSKDPAAAADAAGARAVAEEVGGLPLALEQAAAFVARNPHRRWATYRVLLAGAEPAFVGRDRPRGYDETVATTWAVSVAAAQAEATGALALMEILSQLAPEAIPLDAVLTEETAEDEVFDTDLPGLERALDALYAYSLVQIEPGQAWVHRMVRQAARAAASRAAFWSGARLLRRAAPAAVRDPEVWPEFDRLIPHVLSVVDTFFAADPGTEVEPGDAHELWQLVHSSSRYLRHSGALAAGLRLAEQAHALAAAHLGEAHPDTLAARTELGAAYRAAGRIEDAIRMQQAALGDAERELGHDDPVTLDARADLASALVMAGRFAEAIRLQEDALDTRERTLGDDHPDTLVARGNLAYSYWSVGRLQEAIDLQEQVLMVRKRILGEDHPRTLQARGHLAASYWSAQRIQDAVDLQEQVLAARERIMGSAHPDTLSSRSDLASSYRVQGRLAAAIELQESVLADAVPVFGAAHPYTLIARGNLARSYWSDGRFADAIELQESVLSDRARVLGADHPHTLSARSHLAASYWSAGRHDDAVATQRRVVTDAERILGPDHADTIAAREVLESWRPPQ